MGQKSSWPAYVRDAVEGYGLHEIPIRAVPTPAEVDRAEEVLDWLGKHLKLYVAGAHLLWFSYGRGLSMPQCVVALRSKGIKISRRSGFRKRDVALQVLLSALRKSVPNSAKIAA